MTQKNWATLWCGRRQFGGGKVAEDKRFGFRQDELKLP